MCRGGYTCTDRRVETQVREPAPGAEPSIPPGGALRGSEGVLEASGLRGLRELFAPLRALWEGLSPRRGGPREPPAGGPRNPPPGPPGGGFQPPWEGARGGGGPPPGRGSLNRRGLEETAKVQKEGEGYKKDEHLIRSLTGVSYDIRESNPGLSRGRGVFYH